MTPLLLELVGGAWRACLGTADPEAEALVTYAVEPGEIGDGWGWWVEGQVGTAPTMAAAQRAAERVLERRQKEALP